MTSQHGASLQGPRTGTVSSSSTVVPQSGSSSAFELVEKLKLDTEPEVQQDGRSPPETPFERTHQVKINAKYSSMIPKTRRSLNLQIKGPFSKEGKLGPFRFCAKMSEPDMCLTGQQAFDLNY
jgi:hypothetical protein